MYVVLYLIILYFYSLSFFFKKNKLFVSIIFVILIIFSGLRYYIGTDYPMYMSIFNYIKNDIYNFEVIRMEKGYYYLVKIISLIGGTQQLVFLICAIITNYTIYKVICRDSVAPLLSTMIYFLVGAYYSASFNLVRQVLAISFFLFSISELKRNNNKKFIIFICLGSLFHKSCLILLPIIFFPYLKINRICKIIILFFAIIFNEFLPKLYILFGYGTYIKLNYKATTNFITLFFFLVITLGIEYYGKDLKLDNLEKNFNFAVIVLVTTIFINEKTFPSMNQVFVRMSSYLFFYYIILIPKLLLFLQKKYSRLILIIFFIAISILYFKTFLFQLPKYQFNLKLFN